MDINTARTVGAMNLTAQLIASLMHCNCRDYVRGVKERAEWEREQRELWRMADERNVATPVLRLVCPTTLMGEGR